MKVDYRISALLAVFGFGSVVSDSTRMVAKPENPNKEIDANMTMQEAFKKGLVSDISEYITKAEKSKHVPLTRDTVVIDKHNIGKRICLGAYIDTKDSVYIHILVPDTTDAPETLKKAIKDFTDKYSSVKEVDGVMAHELKHKDTVLNILNNNLSNKQKNMTIVLKGVFGPEDVILFNQHNEISARVATVIQQREKYMKTGDLNVFSSFAKNYRDAIERGVFVPGKMTGYQNELENAYIVKTVFDWWQSHERKANIFVNKQKLSIWFKYGNKKPEKRNMTMYKKLLDIAYTYIKDDKLVCMNYFCDNFGFLNNETYSLKEIEDLMQSTKRIAFIQWTGKQVRLSDATPQEEVLSIIPYLRKSEQARLDRDREKIAEYKRNKKAKQYGEYAKKHEAKLSVKYPRQKAPKPKTKPEKSVALINFSKKRKTLAS